MIYENEKRKNISFPLGGIGTGCIGLAGNGELIDWEIFNRPNKNTRNGYSHFAIKATKGGRSTVRVLHGDTCENRIGMPSLGTTTAAFGGGVRDTSMAGFPHFRDMTFEGTFPLARLTFADDDFPAVVRLCAFNPFIPHDALHSGMPAAFFEWEIENTCGETVEFALAGTVQNPAACTKNEAVSADGMQGILFTSAGKEKTDPGYSDLCLLTDGEDVKVQEYWYRGAWKDGCTMYWKNLLQEDRMPRRSYAEPSKGANGGNGAPDHGTVVSYFRLAPGEMKKVRFVITWNVPVACNYWHEQRKGETFRVYYATVWEDSLSSARCALAEFDALYGKTRLFSEALQSCTLSEAAMDAVAANLSVLKTPTAMRLEDGSFWGWEGCHETVGSCYGSCQHVWNYAYAMPYLFPELERSLRENNLKYALTDSGATSFRIDLPPARRMSTERACVDGQMGEVIKCYREWKLSGDTDWLRAHAEDIFRMLEFAWSDENPDKWDADMDGVLEGRQHHTLDMELFGPSSWLEGFYLLALDCGAKMARALGEDARAALYEDLYRKGRAWTNAHLFNGSYFFHKVDLCDRGVVDRFGAAGMYWNEEAGQIKYQVADGCIIDQMLADWHGVLLGADPVFDRDKKKTALLNLYKNNFKPSMREVTNMWRIFAVNDEGGALICTYPDGANTPAIPISYCEETMTGFEYALAGLLIAEGFAAEGETVVKAIRDRYDGEKRNPFSEIECGSNYARSMASFALLPIYSGFTFDMTKKHIGFAPRTPAGKYLFSVGECWGTVEFGGGCWRIAVLGGTLPLASVAVPDAVTSVTVDGREIPCRRADGCILTDPVTVTEEMILR